MRQQQLVSHAEQQGRRSCIYPCTSTLAHCLVCHQSSALAVHVSIRTALSPSPPHTQTLTGYSGWTRYYRGRSQSLRPDESRQTATRFFWSHATLCRLLGIDVGRLHGQAGTLLWRMRSFPVQIHMRCLPCDLFFSSKTNLTSCYCWCRDSFVTVLQCPSFLVRARTA